MDQKQNKLSVLVAEDDASIRMIVNRALVEAGFEVRATTSVDALERWVEAGEGDVVVSDVYLGEDSIFDRIRSLKRAQPDLPFILMSGQNSILTAAAAADHGAFDYLPKPFDIEEMVNLVRRAASLKNAPRVKPKTQNIPTPDLSFLGRSAPMQKVYRSVTRVMNTKLPVFISGEIGSGKTLTAQSIHDLGNRRSGRFSTQLNDIEGVQTLYVRNVLSLDRDSQNRLADIVSDPNGPRVICGSSEFGQDMGDMAFDLGLLQQIQTIIIEMPPLRARKEDISHIANETLMKAADQTGLGHKSLHPKAIELLEKHEWPGNVQELENVIWRLCVFCPDAIIAPSDVMAELVNASKTFKPKRERRFEEVLKQEITVQVWPQFLSYKDGMDSEIHRNTMDICESTILDLALEFTGQNKLKAAKLLGMNRNTLRARLETLGI